MRTSRAVLVMALCALPLIAWATIAHPASSAHVVAARQPGVRAFAPAQHFTAAPPRPRLQWAVAAPQHNQTAPPGDFPFQTSTSADGHIIVHYYGRDAGFGQRAISTIEGYLIHPIKDTLGLTLKRTVNIYIYANRNDFLIGAQPYDPAITGAYSDFVTGSIYLPLSGIPSDDADSILPHELTHIVFHQNEDVGLVQSQEIRFYPLWLDEGQAEHDVLPGTSYAIYDQQILQAAVASGSVYDLFKGFMFNYPQDPNVDNLGYAEASSFIGYLIATFGATTYHHFVAALSDGQILVAAEEYFGADLQRLQNRWRASIGTTPLPHDSGPPLVAPTAEPFISTTLGGRAAQTTPYTVPGQDQFAGSAALIGIVLTLGTLLTIAAGWFQVMQRRKRLTTARAAEAQAASISAMPSSEPYLPEQVSMRPMSAPIPADAPTLPLPRVAATKAQPLPRVRWLEMLPIALIAPVVLAVELGWAPITRAFEWSQPFQVAMWVAVVGGVLSLALAGLATARRRLTAAYIGGVVVAIILVITAHGAASNAGLAQGQVYEDQGAYALAVRVYTDVGAPGTTLGRVQEAWGQDAETVHDNAAAILHLRAAVTVDPTQDYRLALLQEISQYGQALTNAQAFAKAHAMYATQLASATCDAACQGAMHAALGQSDLAWATMLLIQGHQSSALAMIRGVASDDPHTPAAATAQRVLAGQKNAVSAAVSAGERNDYAAMHLLLLLARGEHSASGILPSEVPVDVTGSITGLDGNSAGGDRAFFAAFTSQSAAENYFSAQDDESVYKVATTLGSSGSYSVRLVPGYWYLVFWEDHTQKYNLNASTASDWSTFLVLPYIPQDEGLIIGN
jgi:hypothetical protein